MDFSHQHDMGNWLDPLLFQAFLVFSRASVSSLFSPIGLECLGSSCGIAPRNVCERPGVFLLHAHLKFNIAPENMPSQQESSLPTIILQGLC